MSSALMLPFLAGIRTAPLIRGLAEEGRVKHIGLRRPELIEIE